MKTEWVRFKETIEPLPVLLLDCVAQSLGKYFASSHDHKTKIKNYGQFLDSRSLGAKDLRDYERMIKNASPEKLILWAKNYEKRKNELLNYVKKISKADFSKYSQEKLIKVFKEYINKCIYTYPFAYDYSILNPLYSERINAMILKYIKDPKDINQYIDLLGSLDRVTDVVVHQKILGEMAIKVKKRGISEKIELEIEKFIKRYGYLGMFTYFGKPFTKEDIRERIDSLVEKELEEIYSQSVGYYRRVINNNKNVSEFIRKYKVTKEDQKLIKVLKAYAYVSIFADEIFHRVGFLMRPLINEIAKRSYLSYNQVIQLTSAEIIQALEGNLNPKTAQEVNQRIKDFGFAYENGQTKVLVGQELAEFVTVFEKEKKDLRNITKLQGQSASPGKVEGIVSILKSTEDVGKFVRGHVLVAKYTSPPYVPAMEKASAIVTNEGGMLSHAAIVSREFRKPCVVGTKIATDVLRDGDLISVDADLGVVKILKRAQIG